MTASEPATPVVHDPSTSLSLTEAAAELGVHYMTAYRYVRLGTLRATKVGTEWRIDADDLAAYRKDPTAAVQPRATVDLSATRRELREALIAGDESAAWDLISPVLASSADPRIVHTELLGPALADIGEAWANGELSIAAEHRATAVARRVIGRSRPWFRGPGRRRGLVVVGAPETDHHALPTALFADLVRANGPDVIDLGAQTPAETFTEIVKETSGSIVIVVVVTHHEAVDQAREIASAVRSLSDTTPVLIGGYAITDRDMALELGATHWCKDSADAAALAASIVQPSG